MTSFITLNLTAWIAIRVWGSLDPEFFHDYFLGF